jgi:hypothetical protein
MPTQSAIDRLGGAHCEALHTARKPRRRICLHEQMQMIGLHTELEDAEGVSGGGAEGSLQR